MLDRGAARPSTAPGPAPRAGRCAAPASRTANARREPGPSVGSLRRLGWGRVHDASRPGGSGAGTARRGAPRPAFSNQTLRAYSPGSCLLLRAGHVQFTSPREVMRSTTAVRPGAPPGRPQASRRKCWSDGCRASKGSRTAQTSSQTGMRPNAPSQERRWTFLLVRGLWWVCQDLNLGPHPDPKI